MKIKSKKRKGFTLIEMTIVLFIISLLILIIIPNISNARQHAQDVHKKAMISMVRSQLDSYLDDSSDKTKDKKPNNLSTLKDAGYLTQDQVTKADSEGIKISDGKVIYKSSDTPSK